MAARYFINLKYLHFNRILCHVESGQYQGGQYSSVLRWNKNIVSAKWFTYYTKIFSIGNQTTSEQPPTDIAITKVSSNIELRRLPTKKERAAWNQDKTKSLIVIFFPWLILSRKTIDRYCSLYHNHGLDVLVVRGQLKHMLQPTSGRDLVKQLLDYLTKNKTPLNTSRFLFHSVSLGDYLYALMVNEMKEDPAKYRITKQKISGRVFDSLTAGVEMPSAISLKIHRPLVEFLARKSISLYWMLFNKHKNFHEMVVGMLKQDPIKGSILVFYSFDDEFSRHESIDELIQEWKNDRSMDLTISSWSHSRHADHIHQHPERYNRALHTFMMKLHIVS